MLVVDDEPENVQFLKRMFRKEYDVEVAQSGTTALAMLERETYDVIITDQMMPGMTGTELLTRSLTLAPEAVRILVTGFPDLESAIASINDGKAYRFFTKPIDRRELVGAIKMAVTQLRDGEQMRGRMGELQRENESLRGRNAELEASVEAAVQERAGELLEEVARLRERNPFDEVTALFNAVHFRGRLEEEIARSERFGLLCSLCLVRATNAHDVGLEHTLERMSDLLRLNLRRFDSAGRWGEDSFALLMPHTDQRGAEACLARLNEALVREGEILLAGAIAVYPISGSTAEELVAEAEKALQ